MTPEQSTKDNSKDEESPAPKEHGDSPSQSSEKSEEDAGKKEKVLFKKPLFIGPRRGVKTALKSKTESVVKADSEEVSVDNSEDQSDVPSESKNPLADAPPLPYSVPEWAGLPTKKYYLEEIKSGVVGRTVDLSKASLVVIGRIDLCDIPMAHPTISRYHAVLQYRAVTEGDEKEGFYVYDLRSTHGTFLNKARIKPKVYAPVKVGHLLKFGCSSRMFMLQGPPEDEEEESSLTFSELKEQRKLLLEERRLNEEHERLLAEEEEERRKREIEERGVNWGMGEDADEETDLSENPYAVTTNEELYADDPKKALRIWFEREGEELHYDVQQAEKGLTVCKLVLPVDNETGGDVTIEESAKSKKEAVLRCALEACRSLDKMGLFRQANKEAKRRKKRDWEENDYYDSDEDSFLDRTGDLEKKRKKRMREAGKLQDTVETYDSLLAKHKDVLHELAKAEGLLLKYNEQAAKAVSLDDSDVDALDAFMESLKNKGPEKQEIQKCKKEIAELTKEETRLRKLVNIAKPATLPELKPVKIEPILPEESSHKKKPKGVKRKHPNPQENTEKSSKQSQPSSVEEPKDNDKSQERKIGPLMPEVSEQPGETEPPEAGETSKKKNRKRVRQTSQKETSPFLEDPEYYNNIVWKPPPGQTGDGRTSLNDKYGY